MAEKKKKYNPRTGQVTTDPEVAEKTGATEEFKPSPEKTFRIGNQVVSKEQYKAESAGNKIIEQGGIKVGVPQINQKLEQAKGVIPGPENNQVQTTNGDYQTAVQEATGLEGFVGRTVNPALQNILQFLGGEFENNDLGAPRLTEKGAKNLALSAAATGAGGALLAEFAPALKGGIQLSNKAVISSSVKAEGTILSSLGSKFTKVLLGGAAWEGLVGGVISNLQSSTARQRSIMDRIVGQVQTGYLDPVDALQEINVIEQQLLKFEKKSQIWGSVSIRYRAGKKYDVETELQETRRAIEQNRAKILNIVEFGQPTLSPNQLIGGAFQDEAS